MHEIERVYLIFSTGLRQKEEVQEILGLYFDGKIDKTLLQVKDDEGFMHHNIIKEDHITILTEPESQYLSHVTPLGGSGKEIGSAILECLQRMNVDATSIAAVGCDGTVVNTGHKSGAVRLLEESLEKPLQWLICLLHMNELPLHHLFVKVDGTTAGPKAFSGGIGKLLPHCENMPITNFKAIETEEEIDQAIAEDLNSDQKYLLEIFNAVKAGEMESNLSHRSPGNLSHSRWLTTANRIPRLYVATENPSEQLLTLATFIMKVYAPMWFRIKCNPSCHYGAKHIFDMISKGLYLP